MARIACVFALIAITTVQCKTRLSDLIPICSLSDPKLNDCAKSSAQKLLPLLAPGIRHLHLIPVDPLQVPNLDIGQDTGPVSLTWKFYNATIKGTSSAIVHSIRVDKDQMKFEGDLTFPRFELSGNYQGKGRILVLPIDGKGFGNVTTTGMRVMVTFSCKLIKKKNVEYLNIEKLDLKFNQGKSFISFTNLFGGNKELGTATNRFLNEHADEIVEEMRGTLEDVFSQLNKQLMNSVFNNIPFNEAFKQ